MTEDKIGLAFSGGGIRSAALSSGVLRCLLHRGVNVHYISCVSGGNYTAAAYLDWKYRNNNADHADWHKTFFEYMRSRAGYVCNWERPLQGILDTVILVLLLITINLVNPCVIYSSGAFPVAFVINYVFGSILRKGLNTTGSTVNTSATIPPCTSGYVRCDPKVRQQFLLFVLLSISFIVFHAIKVVAAFRRISLVARYLQILTGVLFAFTFLPWLIHQFMDALHPWLNICVFVLSIFFWLGFPPLRRKASLAFVLYFYAFVIKWRVYQTKVMGIPYDDHLFYILLLVSSGLIWISPYLGMFSTTASFTYYKWRLQKAFFTPESVGSLCGCGGISFSDFFPILSCCDHQHNPSNDPLVMEDLKDVSPEYISNVAVDYWRIKPSLRESSYAVMSMSPMANERIDHHPGDSVEIKLLPRCVHQADAMVASAAVMALSPKQNEPFRDLQVMLGLTLRKGFRSNPDETMGCSPFSSKIFAVLIQSIAAFPMMFLAIIALVDWDRKDEELYVMAVFVAYYVVFVGIALIPTGGNPPECFDNKFVRWCHVNIYFVRFLRELFKVNNVGPNPPAILSLSDGGRLEKFGLLYLLKKRLKKILIVDGSLISSDADYSKCILKSMDQAREKLNCEFVGLDGRDVKGQMHKEYVDVPSGKQPRHFRFLVQYFDKKEGGYSMVGTGEVMIIAPRHPSKGAGPTGNMGTTWADYGEELDRDDWGAGPVLQEEEVDRLTFCCCESCHTSWGICSEISRKLCLGFPHTSTLNQFFTPSLFTAYHREGYRACVESGAEEFLTGTVAITLET